MENHDSQEKNVKERMQVRKLPSETNQMFTRSGTLKEEKKEGQLSTFSNSVVVIRPDNFSKNIEATADNKFMQDAGMDDESLILQVRIRKC
jgi:hypothetical protein